MATDPKTGLVTPTPEELAEFKGIGLDEFDAPLEQVALFLQISADLLLLRTSIKKAPDPDTPLGRMVSWGIMDLAWYLGTMQDQWTSMFSPFSSERIGSYAYCVDVETQILTKAGWKNYTELSIDDVVLTLNTFTGTSEWQPVKAVHVFEEETRQMLRVHSRTFDSFTTLDHRWAVLNKANNEYEWVKSRDLVENSRSSLRIPTAAPHADLPTVPTYSDDLVEAVAWYWTEGGFAWEGKHSGVKIHQSYKKNPDNCVRIRQCLTSLFGHASNSLRLHHNDVCYMDGCDAKPKARGLCNPHYMDYWRWHRGMLPEEPRVRWTESSRRDGEMAVFSLSPDAALTILAHVGEEKSVSSDFLYSLTKAQLELFINVSLLADGSSSKQLAQKSKIRAEQFALACTLSGRRVSINQNRSGMWCVTFGHRKELNPHGLKYAADNFETSTVFQVEEYNGVVWCPETPNGTWFARRGGKTYFTGNSKSVSAAQSKTDLLGAPLFDEAVKWLMSSDSSDDPELGMVDGIAFSTEHVFPRSFEESERGFTHPGSYNPHRTW